MIRALVALAVLGSDARADSPAPPPKGVVAEFRAPPPVSAEPALTSMTSYFRGEIYGAFTLMAMGLAGVGTGVGLYLASDGNDRDTLRGASYPALAFGTAHLAAGLFVGFASAKRIKKFARDIPDDPEGWIQREEKRMRGVSTQFLVLKVVEGVGIAGGIGLAAYAHETDRDTLKGVGLALATEFAATLIFDIVASRRAKRYRRALGGIAF